MINIVIPMAGAGSRFAKAGYEKPKPFIDVDGVPMIVRVMENLKCHGAKFFLVAQKDHLIREAELVREIESKYDAVFIPISGMTEGTACTVLYARKYIDNDAPLLIANSDQVVDIDMQSYVNDCFERGLDGSIMTFIDKAKDPKWSFAKLDKNGYVVEVKEKEAISDIATVGIYMYLQGKYFVDAAIDMIIRNDRVNNEFYTCPTYNYAVDEGCKIGVYNIDFDKMHGLGTPEDLQEYLEVYA